MEGRRDLPRRKRRNSSYSSSSFVLYFFLMSCFLLLMTSTKLNAQQTISIDANNGVDEVGCGSNETNACKSLRGAVQVASNATSDTFVLALAPGTYSGASNNNIQVPSNVVKIGGQPQSTIISGDDITPVFTISSNISVSDLGFEGLYYKSPVIYILLPPFSEAQFSNLHFLNITGNELFSASLSTASTLILETISLSVDVSPQVTILSANTADSHHEVCNSSYVWPEIQVSSLSAYNVSLSGGFSVTDISFSLFNSTFESVQTSGLFLDLSTSCDTLSSSKPSLSIIQTQFSRFSSSFGPILQSNFGPTVFSGLIFSYYTYINNPLIEGFYPAIELSQPTSLFVDSLELGAGSAFSSGLALNWYCIDSVSCGISLNNNLLSNLNIHDNSFLGLIIEVNSPVSSISPSSFIGVTILDSTFSNNRNEYNLTDPSGDPIFTSLGGGILATYWGQSSSSSTSTFFNGSLVNTLNLNNTLFSYNSALNGGGGLVLQSFVAEIEGTTFFNNSASNVLGLGGDDMQSSCWDDSDAGSFGGGAILAIYQSSIFLSNRTTFNSNFVEGRLSTNVPYRMSGAIHCCSGSLSSVSVHSDGSTMYLENSAPMVDNVHCTNVTWRKPLPTCNYTGTDMNSACDSAPLRLPVWVLVFIMLGLIGSGTGCVVFYKRRKKRIEGYSKL